MADPLVRPDIMDASDPEATGEIPTPYMHRRAVAAGRRHVVVEHDDDLFRIVHLQYLAPRGRRKAEVDHHHEIDIDDREVARCNSIGAARPRQDLLDDRHPHVPSSRRTGRIQPATAVYFTYR